MANIDLACSSLANLPDDLLDRLGTLLVSDLAGGVAALASLAASCQRFRDLFAGEFIARHASLRGVPSLASLEGLAVLETLTALGTNRVFFLDAQCLFRPGASLKRLCVFEALLHRHPKLTLSIEGHTGSKAPERAARGFSHQRAAAVADEILRRARQRSLGHERGVPAEHPLAHRVFLRAWGKAVVLAAGWGAGSESLHAEIFFELGGVVMPPRPTHYAMAASTWSLPRDGDEAPSALAGGGPALLPLSSLGSDARDLADGVDALALADRLPP